MLFATIHTSKLMQLSKQSATSYFFAYYTYTGLQTSTTDIDIYVNGCCTATYKSSDNVTL